MEQLRDLFSRARIQYIVSVDDCHLPKTITTFTAREYFEKNNEMAVRFFDTIGKADYAQTMASLQGQELSAFLESICDYLQPEELKLLEEQFGVTEVSLEQKSLIEFFKELESFGCIKKFILLHSRSQAVEYFNHLKEHLNPDADNKVLWMIDKDLSNSDGSATSGNEIIKKFIDQDKTNSVYALTSGHAGNLNNEDFRISLSQNSKRSDLLLACVIKKDNIIDAKYLELYDQISTGFRENYSGTIIRQVRDIINHATLNAGLLLEKFGDDTIHKVFFESGKAEGVSPIDVMERILLIEIKEDISKNIADRFDQIAKLVYDYSKLCEWCGLLHKSEGDFEVIEKARKDECYDKYINKKFTPVSFGDVFIINKDYYLLIGQACNLAIRDKGYRTAKCATLAQISVAKEDFKSEISNYILNYFDDNKVYFIDFNDCINVDFDVLDLCTLNGKGDLKMSGDFEIENVRHRYPSAVFARLNNVVKANKELIKIQNNLLKNYKKRSLKTISKALHKIYKDNSINVVPEFGSGVSYNGKRCFRLSSELMDDILKKYSEYHSRKALNYDFAQEYKATPFSVEYDINWDRLGVTYSNTCLMDSFVYFQTGKESKLSKINVKNAFCEKYAEYVLKDPSKSNGDFCTVDIVDKSLKVPGKYIPVTVNGQLLTDVIKTNEDDSIGIKIPVEILGTIKYETPKVYNMGNGAKLDINHGFAAFQFPNSVPLEFFNEEILDKPVSFSISFDELLHLSFDLHD